MLDAEHGEKLEVLEKVGGGGLLVKALFGNHVLGAFFEVFQSLDSVVVLTDVSKISSGCEAQSGEWAIVIGFFVFGDEENYALNTLIITRA